MNEECNTEIFAPVVGFEGRYLISNYGNVVSIERNLFCHGKTIKTNKPFILSPSCDKKGYKIVNLYDGSGDVCCKKVHRLVAEAFIPNPHGKRCVCHIDNNPANNHVDNLYWGTDLENQAQAWRDGLHCSELPVAQIVNKKIVALFKSQAEASRKTGITQQNISKCVCGKRKTAGGYEWQRLG